MQMQAAVRAGRSKEKELKQTSSSQVISVHHPINKRDDDLCVEQIKVTRSHGEALIHDFCANELNLRLRVVRTYVRTRDHVDRRPAGSFPASVSSAPCKYVPSFELPRT